MSSKLNFVHHVVLFLRYFLEFIYFYLMLIWCYHPLTRFDALKHLPMSLIVLVIGSPPSPTLSLISLRYVLQYWSVDSPLTLKCNRVRQSFANAFPQLHAGDGLAIILHITIETIDARCKSLFVEVVDITWHFHKKSRLSTN